jgi:hypothetical protein
MLVVGNGNFWTNHLYNIVNRQQSLRDLYLTIKTRYFVSEDSLSNSLTVLGVCNEIVGDKGRAYYCYDTALQNEHTICSSAAKRKVNLNMTWTLITSTMCMSHSVPTKCIVSYYLYDFKEIRLKLHFFNKGLNNQH